MLRKQVCDVAADEVAVEACLIDLNDDAILQVQAMPDAAASR